MQAKLPPNHLFEMKKVRRLKALVDQSLAWLLIGLMAAAVLNVLWQVVTRWVLQDPSSFTEELARYLLIWLGLLGAAYAAGQGLHLSINLVPTRLAHSGRKKLEGLIQIFVFLFALVVMVVGGVQLVELTLRFGQTSAALGAPLGLIYLVIPFSGLLIMFYAAVEMVTISKSFHAESQRRPPGSEMQND